MFQNRWDAGERLAERLAGLGISKPCLLAVPRGGAVVAAPVAKRLAAPVYILTTRKIGHPLNPEVAVGAVMPDGTAVFDEDSIRRFAISRAYLEDAVAREYQELKRRRDLYGGAPGPGVVAGRTAIVADDGIATGYTVRAAVQWLRGLSPARIIIAAPVGPPDVVAGLVALADDVICLIQPDDFIAVGAYYQEFLPTGDDEVVDIVRRYNGSCQQGGKT